MFRRPSKRESLYLLLVAAMYASALVYAHHHDLSIGALFGYGLLQPKGVTGEQARLAEVATPLSSNVPQVAWFVYIKGAAVLVELFQYWVVGMFIAGSLVVFVPWERVRRRMGYGGLVANLTAATAGAVIPICSCGIVPVLAGMVEAGIPLGPTMAFLIAAPMLNVPAVFITAGVLGWKMAIGRILGTFFIALMVGEVLSRWQRRERLLRRFVKLSITPTLPLDLQTFAVKVVAALSRDPGRLTTGDLAPRDEQKLYLLGEAGVLDRDREGRWFLPQATGGGADVGPGCFVLPEDDSGAGLSRKLARLFPTAWDFFIQLNSYLVLATLIAGGIKVLIPTDLVVRLVGGTGLNSVLVAALIAVLAYVCTYVEVPTALALIQKGMGGGATLAYLLGGPGVSLPSIAMLSGVFRTRVLMVYVGLSFLGCVIAGYVFNLLT